MLDQLESHSEGEAHTSEEQHDTLEWIKQKRKRLAQDPPKDDKHRNDKERYIPMLKVRGTCSRFIASAPPDSLVVFADRRSSCDSAEYTLSCETMILP